jgi:hypothetical protein
VKALFVQQGTKKLLELGVKNLECPEVVFLFGSKLCLLSSIGTGGFPFFSKLCIEVRFTAFSEISK